MLSARCVVADKVFETRKYTTINILSFIVVLGLLIIITSIKSKAASYGLPDSLVSVTIDPKNSKIIYLPTRAGLYKSIDAGANWNLVNNEFGMWESKITIDPNNSAVLYTNAVFYSKAYPHGIFAIIKSNNSGHDWHLLTELEDYYDYRIFIDPNNSSIVYTSNEDRIYKSTNAGLNWEKIFSVAKEDANGPIVLSIGSQRKSSILYVCVPERGGHNRIIKSIDDGKSWINIDHSMDVPRSWGHMIKTIAVSPHNSNIIFAVFPNRLYKSSNGGKTWVLIKKSPYDKNDAEYIEIIFTNNQNVIYLNTELGIYRSANGGKDWKPTHPLKGVDNMVGSQIFTVDPRNYNIIYAGLREYSLYKSSNGGRTWKEIFRRPLIKE